ncbi:MAG: 50S ribosomal protein L34e [Candidatus Aenigmatarchaeota archaeon]|nr:MAG: 50S ribosomal protein L34e [Candidatus Aenigmarchaeota archaeon]
MPRVKVRLPSGKVVIRERKKKPRIAKCAICKRPLHGIPRLRASQLKKLAKTKKRPERPYGGYLCSKCMRELMREKARKLS